MTDNIDRLLGDIEATGDFERRQNDMRQVVGMHRAELARLEMMTESLREHVEDLEDRYGL